MRERERRGADKFPDEFAGLQAYNRWHARVTAGSDLVALKDATTSSRARAMPRNVCADSIFAGSYPFAPTRNRPRRPFFFVSRREYRRRFFVFGFAVIPAHTTPSRDNYSRRGIRFSKCSISKKFDDKKIILLIIISQ